MFEIETKRLKATRGSLARGDLFEKRVIEKVVSPKDGGDPVGMMCPSLKHGLSAKGTLA